MTYRIILDKNKKCFTQLDLKCIIKINGTKMCIKLKSYILSAKSHNFMFGTMFHYSSKPGLDLSDVFKFFIFFIKRSLHFI